MKQGYTPPGSTRAQKKLPVLKLFGGVAIAAALSVPGTASSGVSEGIDQLAAQIVTRSVAADRTTIAIAAFPHVDDTCSELSNFLVDELVLSLFSLPDNQLSIIERSQLDRIFSELELSLSGAVDVNTTQELGRVHGVDTLLVGTLSNFGEDLRVNARLIDTETARVYSAAAVNIPRTSTFEALMERPAAGGCTMMLSGEGARTPSQGGNDAQASGAHSFEGLQGEFEMSDLEGIWMGTRTCNGYSEPRSMQLTDANPAGLQVRYWHSARPDRSSGGRLIGGQRVNLTYDFRRVDEGIWFTFSPAGGIPLQLLAGDVLFGEGVEEDDKECDYYFGKYE